MGKIPLKLQFSVQEQICKRHIPPTHEPQQRSASGFAAAHQHDEQHNTGRPDIDGGAQVAKTSVGMQLLRCHVGGRPVRRPLLSAADYPDTQQRSCMCAAKARRAGQAPHQS